MQVKWVKNMKLESQLQHLQDVNTILKMDNNELQEEILKLRETTIHSKG